MNRTTNNKPHRVDGVRRCLSKLSDCFQPQFIFLASIGVGVSKSIAKILCDHYRREDIRHTRVVDRPHKMLIPSSTIAEYVELRSRLAAIERTHPGIASYFKSRIKMEISDDQKLINLQAAISSDRELEARSTEAIGRLAAKIGEEQAVLTLARRFYEYGDIERTIASLR